MYILCVLLCSIETIIVSLCANKDIIIVNQNGIKLYIDCIAQRSKEFSFCFPQDDPGDFITMADLSVLLQCSVQPSPDQRVHETLARHLTASNNASVPFKIIKAIINLLKASSKDLCITYILIEPLLLALSVVSLNLLFQSGICIDL